jgi:hypothetical protein
LTAKGRAALGRPRAETIRTLWRSWVAKAPIDELSRVEHIKGQRTANTLTSAKTRRQTVATALARCPVDEWIASMTYDYRGNWGADDLDYLSRYDGLRAVRLNALGAYALGLTDDYQAPAANAAVAGVLKVLPNRRLLPRKQQTMRALAAQSTTPIRIMRLDVADLLGYAQREGKDPARRQTRLDFAGWLHSTGRTGDLWPPERNAPCWCGSGGKYKKCLATPASSPSSRPTRPRSCYASNSTVSHPAFGGGWRSRPTRRWTWYT